MLNYMFDSTTACPYKKPDPSCFETLQDGFKYAAFHIQRINIMFVIGKTQHDFHIVHVG